MRQCAIGVIALIVITLLRWMDHLSKLGRVTETNERVENATISALRAWKKAPCLGEVPYSFEAGWREKFAVPVKQDVGGHVQHVDARRLSGIADEFDIEIAVAAIAGTLLVPDTALVWLSQDLPEAAQEEVRKTFTAADVRSFDQDPRFGALVLAEIASRALSKAVNDPETALDVNTRSIRLSCRELRPFTLVKTAPYSRTERRVKVYQHPALRTWIERHKPFAA